MNELVRPAAEHWAVVSLLLRRPATDTGYDRLAALLDDVLTFSDGNADHPLSEPASAMGDLIEAYDEERRSLPSVSGADALRYPMREHGILPSHLPEIGDVDAVSGLLDGRARIDLAGARTLALRFSLPIAVFLEPDRETGVRGRA